jgi:hypothetical protein
MRLRLFVAVIVLAPPFAKCLRLFDTLGASLVNQLPNTGLSAHESFHQRLVKRAGYRLSIDWADGATNLAAFVAFGGTKPLDAGQWG